MTTSTPVLEPATKASADTIAKRAAHFQLDPVDGPKTVNELAPRSTVSRNDPKNWCWLAVAKTTIATR
jgi:hypothetical protein